MFDIAKLINRYFKVKFKPNLIDIIYYKNNW